MTMLKDIQNSVGSLYFEGDGGYSMVNDSDSDVLLGNNCGGSGGTSKGKIGAHEVFVEMTMSRFLEKYGTVSNYYDSFNSHWSSILTKVEDWYLADLFTCGLPVEIRDKVRIFKPKDLSDACSLASLQVFAYNLMKKKLNESKENEMEESREDNGMGKEIGCLKLTDLDENVLHNSSKVCDIKEGATCDDLQSHDEESIENKEVISLVNLGCGKSDVKMDSGGSGNSNFEAKHVKQIVVNSSNRSDKNFNFDKVEINRNEYEDSDIILRDLLLGQIVTDGQEVEKRIDDATFEYDVQQILENIHHNEESLSQQKKLKEVVEQCGMWEWPNMKKASYIKFKFRGKFWKFDRWKWCKRRKVGGAKCECKYKKVNFDIWKWPLRKKDGLESVVLDGICGALATCKVFIDELDVVGRQRGASLECEIGEREQTLQQLLAEMDGFSGNTGVFVLVAANRSDSVLSTGLLRSGGFDKELFMVSFKASLGLKELFDVDENGFTANKSVVTKRSVDKVENYLVSVGNLEELFLGLFESSDGLDTTSVRWPKRQKDRGKKEVMVVWVRMRIASTC